MNTPRCTTKRRINALSFTNLVKALQDDALTVHELVEHVGLCLLTVRHYVLTMHREQVCRIAHWERDKRGRYTTPAYTLGSGKDATKPVVSQSARAKMYRTRNKQVAVLAALAGSSQTASGSPT